MAKFCSNCGKALSEGSDVCLNCGASVNNGQKEYYDKCASKSLTFGILSLITWIIPLFGYITTILGIVNAKRGFKSETKVNSAKIGMVLSILGLIASLINSTLGVLQSFGVI